MNFQHLTQLLVVKKKKNVYTSHKNKTYKIHKEKEKLNKYKHYC